MRGAPPGGGSGIEHCRFARKGHRAADVNARCACEQDGEEFGRAVDREPADGFQREPLPVIEPQQRPQHRGVLDQQQHRRQAERETQREGKQRDLRVVRKQLGSENTESGLVLLAKQRAHEHGAAGSGHAGIDHPAGHQRVVPVGIARHEQPADHGACHHQRERDEDIAAKLPHAGAPAPAEEAREPVAQTGARAIDDEPGALGQHFEPEQRLAVKRGLTRDREAGDGGAVERGEREQVFVRYPAQPSALDPRDNRLKPLPFALALQPKAVGPQRGMFGGGDFGTGGGAEPAAQAADEVGGGRSAHPKLPSRLTAR